MPQVTLPKFPVLGSSLAADLLQPGTIIGPYTITGLIAFGMMGGLYSGIVRAERREVSLWVLPSSVAKDPEVRLRLNKANKRLTSIQHQNLLKMNRVDWSDGRCAIEMEAIKGQTLEQWLIDDGARDENSPTPMNEERAGEILRSLAGALAECHAKDVCHFNLVPSSILILDDESIKLGGFGLVQQLAMEQFQKLASASVPPVRTDLKEKTLLITDVRSPEVQAGAQLTRASDIFHFGSLAYFLLTGRRFQNEQSPAPHKLNPHIAKQWSTLIGRCLCVEDQGRYTSIQQVEADLRNLDNIEERGGLWDEKTSKAQRKKRRIRIRIPDEHLKALVGVTAAILVALGVSWRVSNSSIGDSRFVTPTTPETADIIIRVDSTPARVEFSGTAKGSLLTKTGVVAVKAPSGDYVIKAHAEGHLPETVETNFEKRPLELNIALKPAFAQVEIHTQPFAQIERLGEDGQRLFLGTADARGILDLNRRLLAGRHTLLVSAEGFETQQVDANLQMDENPSLKLPLMAAPAAVMVKAGPKGAEIWINGQLAGSAPLSLDGVRIGDELLIEARATGYRQKQMRWTAQKTGEIDLGELEPEVATISARVSFADGLQRTGVRLSMDGKAIAPGELINVSSGTHVLRAEHPDFEPTETVLELKDRENFETNLVLQPKPAELLLTLGTAVDDFTIQVDGKPVGSQGPVRLEPGKEVEVAVFARNYLTVRRRLVPSPNEAIRWDVRLVPIPGAEIGHDWVIPYLNQNMVWIDPGSFRMGSPRGELENRPNEGPQTEAVFTSGFWMGTVEVTQLVYEQVMGENPSSQKGEQLPVHNVSWQDAMEFCRRLTERERESGRLPSGYVYRLPTEAEWEYACRAGTETPFNFGMIATPADANLQGRYPRSHNLEAPAAKYGFVPVGSYTANSWGLHDMHGNAAEWCLNLFNSRLSGGTVIDWTGPSSGRDRPVRGGSWADYADRCRSAARERMDPRTSSAEIGFRVVLAPKTSE